MITEAVMEGTQNNKQAVVANHLKSDRIDKIVLYSERISFLKGTTVAMITINQKYLNQKVKICMRLNQSLKKIR